MSWRRSTGPLQRVWGIYHSAKQETRIRWATSKKHHHLFNGHFFSFGFMNRWLLGRTRKYSNARSRSIYLHENPSVPFSRCWNLRRPSHFFVFYKKKLSFGSTNFLPANANMVLNFLKLERHFLGWKVFWVKLWHFALFLAVLIPHIFFFFFLFLLACYCRVFWYWGINQIVKTNKERRGKATLSINCF